MQVEGRIQVSDNATKNPRLGKSKNNTTQDFHCPVMTPLQSQVLCIINYNCKDAEFYAAVLFAESSKNPGLNCVQGRVHHAFDATKCLLSMLLARHLAFTVCGTLSESISNISDEFLFSDLHTCSFD